ncbi:hypothetical protein FIBSPDRAFT_935960 [Athelia psychrophila]|uniref:Uncharacterized protein n=1 Tax=Athelia psychrophila TaxID=1759441 RepID=A0A166CVS6_9AGAM|nr:hypothetical protein FIBSPDRAFT_935960 [Fibularhizoctonia sp. CBS 109695]
MPLALFIFVSLSLLQSCTAPAVSDLTANLASPFLDTTSSLASSNSTSDTCNDINNCRTVVGIVTSCLATIIACIWSAVHPNVPGPSQSSMSRQIESLKIIVVTLLAPEWVLAWAVRQSLQAREYAEMLERARVEAAEEAILYHSQSSTHEGHATRYSSSGQESDQAPGIRLEEHSTPHDNLSKDSTCSVGEVTRGEPDNEQASLIPHQHLERLMGVLPEPAGELVDIWQLEMELGRTNQSWTKTHAFLVGMGGFHSYRGGELMFPLEYDNVLALVESRSLVPPTSDEIGDKSKGDAFSKTIAVFQTLWFVAQCITRGNKNLAITNLEIVTLAYAVITVAMYAAWWHKPLNDQLVVLSGEERVPTFWSNSTSTGSKLPLIIAVAVAMVFGAVQCGGCAHSSSPHSLSWQW